MSTCGTAGGVYSFFFLKVLIILVFIIPLDKNSTCGAAGRQKTRPATGRNATELSQVDKRSTCGAENKKGDDSTAGGKQVH